MVEILVYSFLVGVLFGCYYHLAGRPVVPTSENIRTPR